ncbi:hypothetical protein DM860_006069 [Cuscuta australis]|uniref:Uncharacterized protein n=1 Tax=Cuscuta australis TaxID=267555 RepID=A0A328DJE2_9ASTE|nr:hypothetical protein DM860_006069 [Cuscuta australis]
MQKNDNRDKDEGAHIEEKRYRLKKSCCSSETPFFCFWVLLVQAKKSLWDLFGSACHSLNGICQRERDGGRLPEYVGERQRLGFSAAFLKSEESMSAPPPRVPDHQKCHSLSFGSSYQSSCTGT